MNKNKIKLSTFKAGLLTSIILGSAMYAQAESYFNGWKSYPEPSHILKAQNAGKTEISDYLRWKRLTTNKDVKISHTEAINFIKRNQGWRFWPRHKHIQRRIEEAFNDTTKSKDILSFYQSGIQPSSGNGWYYYLRALEQQGKPNNFSQLIKSGWARGSYTETMQKKFINRYGKYLDANDHTRRLDNLLYRGLAAESRRMFSYVSNDWKKLAEARLALRYKGSNANQAVANVPKNLKSNKGLQYERIRWRQAKGLKKDAIDLAFDVSKPDDWAQLWWKVQKKAGKDAYQLKRYKTAYKITAKHAASSPTSRVFLEGEWLSGRSALKVKGWEDKASLHFSKLYDQAPNPEWRARGAYWNARSLAQKNDKENALIWYRKAAQFPYTYYGQIAAGKANMSIPELLKKERMLPIKNGASILALPSTGNNRLAQIAKMLVRNNRTLEARYFANASCPSGSGANVIKACASWARSIGLPDAALSMSKRLENSGKYILMSELYPAIKLPIVKNSSGKERLEKSFIHAIIRQESAFDHDVGSYAGAKGYMQLMSATAKETAQKYGLKWSGNSKLFTQNYNITLGTHYLADQVKKFNGSYILAAAAYNAGPSRVRQWIKRYGDPRSNQVNAIDWVEQIPIAETKGYIQHILENLLVYRALFDDRHKNESLSSIMANGGIPKRFR